MAEKNHQKDAERGLRYMERIREAKKRVIELTERIEEYDAMISRCAAALAAPNFAGVEGGAMSLLRLRERLSEELSGYAARVREAEWAIEQLEDPTERAILRYRYLCGLDFETLAERMHYCDGRYMRRLCMRALSHLTVADRPLPRAE